MAHVNGASDDEGVVASKLVDVLRVLHFDIDALLREGCADPGGEGA
jgi:hypothetical protein